MIKFPEKFYFGSAISATQSESSFEGDGKGKDVWDYYYEIDPYKFHNKVFSCTDIYKNYKEDIKLLKETGHNSYRTSISWSRLMPDGYTVNEKAVDFYKDYFKLLKESGIKTMICLYHFDTPMELQKKGGFLNKEVVEAYRLYAKKCFELFSEYVDIFFTFNEPIVTVECGYLLQYHYPLEVDPKKAVQVAYNIALANALAVKEYKDKYNGKIGIILNLTPAYPRSNNEKDVKAGRIAELFANKSFLDPAVRGEYDKELIEIIKEHNLMPEYTKEELDIIKENTVNFLGVNYYHPHRVKCKEHEPNKDGIFMPNYYYDEFEMPGRRMNIYRGWEIYPKGIYDIAVNIRDNYGNIEWMITENGMGVENEERFRKDGIIEDDYRIEFFKEHLEWLHKGIEEGSNCIGYHVWTFIDCWSWMNSYKNRYGLVELDLETKERRIKKSGRWFKELLENRGF